uniref:Translocase of outer mitochondrial membrane 20 n=1 Tax=Syphacia muris TaxID=451379 RepID=A0A0N5AXJ8_9BILA
MSSVQGSSSLSAFFREHMLTAASVAAAAFVGYCIYFDHKRRCAPDYKQKIRENRRAAAKAKALNSSSGSRSLPNFADVSEIQAFFLQEVQLGEEMIAAGNLEEGTDHICNAVTVCGQQQQLLQIFEQALPPEHYAMVIQKLPEAKLVIKLIRIFTISLSNN